MPNLLENENSFKDTVGKHRLTLVHFAADWVEQCVQVDELLDVLGKQKDFSDVQFTKCKAEQLSEVSLKYNIEAVPTVILFQNGQEIDRIDGADPKKITEKLKEHHKNTDRTEPLENRLNKLINRSKVMLFMKGDRNGPRCGFSKQIIQILNDAGITYDTFDILTDEEVRQGLKVLSQWPTYPQLYVKGELIGGLDIIKEILAAGDLNKTLNP